MLQCQSKYYNNQNSFICFSQHRSGTQVAIFKKSSHNMVIKSELVANATCLLIIQPERENNSLCHVSWLASHLMTGTTQYQLSWLISCLSYYILHHRLTIHHPIHVVKIISRTRSISTISFLTGGENCLFYSCYICR